MPTSISPIPIHRVPRYPKFINDCLAMLHTSRQQLAAQQPWSFSAHSKEVEEEHLVQRVEQIYMMLYIFLTASNKHPFSNAFPPAPWPSDGPGPLHAPHTICPALDPWAIQRVVTGDEFQEFLEHPIFLARTSPDLLFPQGCPTRLAVTLPPSSKTQL